MSYEEFLVALRDIYVKPGSNNPGLGPDPELFDGIARLPEKVQQLGRRERSLLTKPLLRFFQEDVNRYAGVKRLCVQEYWLVRERTNMREAITEVLEEEMRQSLQKLNKVRKSRVITDMETCVRRNMFDSAADSGLAALLLS
ncbi:MAG: hypothetical protein HY051_04040 [Candidatus Aenigmarchaeota archaeon]|nr:hypothetical protein [Candidatus Aenigmarchaeota archaeon]